MSILDGDFTDRVTEAADAAHRRLVLRIAAYFDESIRPTLRGIPEDVILLMRAKYIVEVRKNPKALRYFTEED